MDKVADAAIRGATAYDGSVYVVSLIIIGIIAIAGLCIWFIAIPNSKSSRDNSAKLAEATIAISQITGQGYKLTQDLVENVKTVNNDVVSVRLDVSKLMACAETATRAMDKIAEQTKVDIASEIGEMRGTLKLSSDKIKSN